MDIIVGSWVKSRENEGLCSGGQSVDGNVDPDSSGVDSVGDVPGLVLSIGPDEGEGVLGLGSDLEV
jgi:hypothetical protein